MTECVCVCVCVCVFSIWLDKKEKEVKISAASHFALNNAHFFPSFFLPPLKQNKVLQITSTKVST